MISINDRVAVVGTGVIGASWVSLFLAAGYKVEIYDSAEDSERQVRDYVTEALPALKKIGLIGELDTGVMRFHNNLGGAVKDACFVQESVPEKISTKHELYAEMEPHLSSSCIVASSSSGLMLSDMQKGWKDPSRFLLAHPFNPPHLIPLVELQVNEQTSDGVLKTAEDFYKQLGKVTIRLKKEVAGQVANRLQAALWREAIHLVVSGVVSVEDVDKAVWAGPGLRWAAMGPHMLFHLGAGQGGIEAFCKRLGPSFEQWWEDLGTPHITPEVIASLKDGLRSESKDKTLNDLVKERDEAIISIIQVLKT